MSRLETILGLLNEIKETLNKTRANERKEVVDMEEDGTKVVDLVRVIDRQEAELAIQKINSVFELIRQEDAFKLADLIQELSNTIKQKKQQDSIDEAIERMRKVRERENDRVTWPDPSKPWWLQGPVCQLKLEV